MLKIEKLCRGETFVNFAHFDTFRESFSSRNSIKYIILDIALGLTTLPQQNFNYFILLEQLGYF